MTTVQRRPDTEKRDRIQEQRDWLECCGPMPSAADIAGPFLQGIYALHDIAQRLDSYRILAERAGETAEGVAMVGAIRHALDLLEWATEFCGGDRNLSIRQNVRLICHDLLSLEAQVEQSEVDAILAGGAS